MFRLKGEKKEDNEIIKEIFDPETVIDKGTFEDPAQHPVGIRHVLVNGAAVLVDGEPIEGATPGQAIRAPIKTTSATSYY